MKETKQTTNRASKMITAVFSFNLIVLMTIFFDKK